MKPASRLSVLFFLLIAAAHLVRVIAGIPVTIGTLALPIWPSIIAVVVPTLLAIALWREHQP